MGAPAEIREWIRDVAARGADGLKIIAVDRDQLEAILDEAHRLGAAHHHAYRPSKRPRRSDYVELGVSSIEHFYGVAEAAMTASQRFRPDMNYNDEIHRFGRRRRRCSRRPIARS